MPHRYRTLPSFALGLNYNSWGFCSFCFGSFIVVCEWMMNDSPSSFPLACSTRQLSSFSPLPPPLPPFPPPVLFLLFFIAYWAPNTILESRSGAVSTLFHKLKKISLAKIESSLMLGTIEYIGHSGLGKRMEDATLTETCSQGISLLCHPVSAHIIFKKTLYAHKLCSWMDTPEFTLYTQ